MQWINTDIISAGDKPPPYGYVHHYFFTNALIITAFFADDTMGLACGLMFATRINLTMGVRCITYILRYARKAIFLRNAPQGLTVHRTVIQYLRFRSATPLR